MSKRSAVGIWMLLLAILITVSACHRPEHDPRHLRAALEAAPRNLDPRFATDVASSRIDQLVFSSLLRKTPESELVGDLAERWEIPDDRTYVFHLRPGITFHDGHALTAADVVYTFESTMDPELGSPKRMSLDAVESVEALDELTVQFRLKRVFAPFLINTVLGIVPRPADGGPGAEYAQRPVGTGPFQLTRWTGEDAFELERFDGYHSGAPWLSSITVRVLPDATMRLLELESGSVDFIQGGVPLDSIARLGRIPEIRMLQTGGSNYSYLGFNLADPVLSDERVRRAVGLAMDRRAIIDGLLEGHARPATGLLPEGHWAYRPVPALPHDPAEARRLLAEAGHADGLTLTFKCSENKETRRLAEVLQSQLAQVGIRLEIKAYEWGTFYQDILDGNFQLYSLTWVGITDPDIYHSIFHSAQTPPNGRNRGRYSNPRVDELLEEARGTLDRERSRTIYGDVQEILARDLPYVSLWFKDQVVALRTGYTGFTLYPAGDWDPLAELRWAGE